MDSIFLFVSFFSFVGFMVGIPVLFGVARLFGFYVIVRERKCHVYILFGDVIGTIQDPGLHFLWPKFGWRALIVHIFGEVRVVDMRLDQVYLRSLPVNSEEGAPVGMGVWYEMFVSDPVNFLFKNTDPRGSLSANVSNSVVRCLSNMPLSEMLMTRHKMSQTVRNEVSPNSREWGYQLGSVYIRKVHFRDSGMIKQIESKVVNRLRQVTSAIKQDGMNQVNIISSTAEKKAAVEFAKAAAIRPQIVGEGLKKIMQDAEVGAVLFDILENQKILDSNAETVIIPKNLKIQPTREV
jgi:regulator of protease activity HflC (stomatin/prohibitin superfamily)